MKKGLGKKKYSSIIQVTIFMLCISSVCVAGVVEFTDEVTFKNETGSPQYFIDFESYGDGTPVVGAPTISGNEWLNLGIQFAEMEIGYSLILSEKEGMGVSPTHALATAGLSPGNDRSSRLITFSTPVISFGVYIVDNETTSVTERIILKDENGNVLGDFAMPGGAGPAPPLPIAHDFIGYSSTIPIAEVHILEANDGEGSLLDNVMYSVTAQELAGPVAYWSFDNLADPGYDDSENGHNGVVYGAISTDGICSNALSFDGSGDYVGLPSSSSLSFNTPSEPFSTSFWIKPDTIAPIIQAILENEDDYLVSLDEGLLRYRKTDSGNLYHNVWQSTNNEISAGNWSHIAITYDGTGAGGTKMYVNGEEKPVTTHAYHGGGSASGDDFAIGIRAFDFASEPYGGEIDEVRIYDRVLSECEIQELVDECPESEQPQLLFRERDAWIPGFDHVGLYPGNGELVWESHKGYDAGSYWDPETDSQIDVEDINGVQQEHSHGSFFHDSKDPCTSPVTDQDSVGIDRILAEQMTAAIESLGTSHYSFEWFIGAGIGIQIPSLQKGLTGGYTCCGLVEWAAEYSGYNGGEGFVPDIIEWKFFLAPSVQRWCILGAESIWDSAKKKLVGWFDPIDFILTDPLGHRLGHANGQSYNEIPDAFYTGDGDFEIFGIADRLSGDYTIEFFGLGQDYNSVIRLIDINDLVQEWTFSGHLDTGESVLEVLPENRSPVASAGGPYIAQATSWSGASIVLDGTGSTDPDGDAITYEWDLDLSVDSDADGDPNNDVDANEPTPEALFPIGQTEISLVVTDEYGAESAPDVTTVTVSFIEVSIDIKPGSEINSINMGSHGVIPVAFLTNGNFDAATIDPATVTLRGEDFSDGLVKLRGKKEAVPMANLEDVDGDGDEDLIVHLETEKLAEYELEAVCEIGALTYDGYVVSGSDTIRIVPE